MPKWKKYKSMIRNCKLCNKQINVKEDKIGRKGYSVEGAKKGVAVLSSKEGVFFSDNCRFHCFGVWFCNDCWNLMTKDVFKKFQKKNFDLKHRRLKPNVIST